MDKINRRKINKIFMVIIMLFLIIGVTLFTMSKNAATINRCKIKVIDDGSSQKQTNVDVSVSQKIIGNTDKEVTFQVDFENYLHQTTQIALVIDNSYSMWSENKLTNSKASIINLVNNLFDNIENVELSLTTYEGNKVAMGKDRQSIINQINSITEYSGITTKTGLTYAQDVFTKEDVNKYIILFSDGEENISDVIEKIKNKGIKLRTVFYGQSNFLSNQYSKAGTVYPLTTVTDSGLETINSKIEADIKANMINEIKNVDINNVFSNEIINNFTFEILKTPTIGTITPSDDGYIWHINSLSKNNKASFQYKLILKNNLERNIMYKNIATNGNMNITYNNTDSETKSSLENKNTPVIYIEETYTLKVKVINKKYLEINASGIEYKIEQIDENGNVIRTESAKTNSDGEIIINDITQNGNYTYRLTQISTPAAYEPSEESKRVKTISVNKDYLSDNLTATTTEEDETFNIETNNNEKVVTAIIKLDPRQFILDLSKIDEEYKNSLKDVEFSLDEPKGGNIPEGISVNGRTDENGRVVLTGEVAGKGTYTYTLKEKNTPEGYYENKEKMGISITFDENGMPTNVSSSSEKILKDSENAIEGNTINLKVQNKMLDYTLKIQTFNKKYTHIKISNVTVKIIGRDSNGNIVYQQEETTKSGEINLKINKYGPITYTIQQISAPPEYEKTSDIEYQITRNFTDNNLVLNSPTNNENIILDNESKLLTVKLYLEQKTFNFKVNKVDKDSTSDKLDGAKVTLTQSEGRSSIQGTTQNGYTDLLADVICKKINDDGTYTATYTLEENIKPNGYKKIDDEVKVEVTFDSEGKVIKAKSLNTDILEIIKDKQEVETNLKNEKQSYSVQVIAKDKIYENVTIPNVQIDIRGTKDEDNFLQQTALTTNEKGETPIVKDLRQDGDLEFTIEETRVPVGYIANTEKVHIRYNYQSESLSLLDKDNESTKVTIDNKNKIIKIIILIQPKTFKLEINKYCSLLEDTLIGGATFTLHQPNIRDNIKREIKEDATVLNEVLSFEAEVAGEGTYSYILKETEVPNGYEKTGIQLNLNITFDSNGRITNITNLETHNPISIKTIDESNDYISTETDEDYALVKNVVDRDNQDIIPIFIKNKQQKSNLEINLINKNYNGVVMPNVDVTVVGQDSNGEFYNKTLKTDSEGKIRIAGIDNIGDFDFNIRAINVPSEYVNPENDTIAYLNKNVRTTALTERINEKNVSISGNTVIVKLLLEPKTFDIEISKYEKNSGDLLIPNVGFTLEQPSITEDVNRRQISGITEKEKTLILTGEVAGEGIYQYTIKETKPPEGYIDNKIKFTLNIEFDANGNIVNVEKANDENTINSNEYVNLKDFHNNIIPISVINSQKDYSMTVELTNSKYKDEGDIKGVKIPNAKIKVIGVTSNGNEVYSSNELQTNENGLVKFEPLTQRGDVTYKIIVLEVPTGYIIPEEKTIQINKDEVTTNISLIKNDQNVEIDNITKNIHVELFADIQTFDIEINKKDKDEDNLLIGGAKFTIEQPKFERGNKSRKNISGTTVLNESLILTGEVAGEEGPYIYKIKETVPVGYTANNPETQLQIYFNKDGTVKNVECLNNENDAYINTQNTNGKRVSVDVLNSKKAYKIKVVARSSEDNSKIVEGLKLNITGKDSNDNIIYNSENLVTDSSGITSTTELQTMGDVSYEIEQLEDVPAGYILGDSKIINLNINRQNNEITSLDEENNGVYINNNTKEITVKIYLKPKKFKINLDKLDYDDKLKSKDTFVDGATFLLTDYGGKKKTYITKDQKTLSIEATVGGEGTYTYKLEESIPNGYQEFYAIIILKITFDSKGEIIQEENEEGKSPVVMDVKWKTWRINDKGNIEWYETENPKSLSGVIGSNKNNANIYITNVKKEYSLVINVIDDKYETGVSDVDLQVTAINENNEKIFDEIMTTRNGVVTVKELRQTGKVRFEIKQVKIPTQYEDFGDKHIEMTKDFPARTITIDQNNTSQDINASVIYADLTKAKGPVNSPTTVSMDILLHRKTFDINVKKVDLEYNNILLPNAGFHLIQYDKKHTQSEITDENGELKLSADIEGFEKNSQEGTKEYVYMFQETVPPNGYRGITEPIELHITLNKQDEIVDVKLINGGNYISEISENRTLKSIDILAKNQRIGGTYNLQVTRKHNKKTVEDLTYKIKVEATTGENLTIRDITDKKGQINVSNIPESQKIKISLSEIKGPEGYEIDQTERFVVVERSSLTGKVEIIKEETSSDVIAEYDEKTNTIRVLINTEQINEKPKPIENSNIIRVISVDKNDEEKRVSYSTVQIVLPETEDVIEKTTDSNGCIDFNDIQVPKAGTYRYIFKVINTPKGYLDYQGGDIVANITFDENGNIVDTSLQEENEYAEGYYTKEENDTTVYNIANIVEKNTPEETIMLNLNKKGEEDINLANVQFNILAITTIENEEVISNVDKKTNAEGKLTCEILSGDNIEIAITEKQTHEAYKLDSVSKNIILKKVDGVLQIADNNVNNQVEFIDNNLNVTLTNEYKPSKVIMQLINEDEQGNAIKLKGIKVKLKELSSNKEYEVTTDEAGEINFEDLPVEDEGTYKFVITQMSNIQGFEMPQINEQNPINIIVDYERSEEGKLTVNNVTYSSPDDIVQGVSYTNYSAPEEYRVFLKVVLSEKISEDAKFNVNLYKLDRQRKENENVDIYLKDANFDIFVDYYNDTGLSFNETTDEQGKISRTIPFVLGDMKINLQELTAPEGYNIDDKELREIILNKDSNGNITLNADINSDSMYTTFDNSGINIYVKDTKNIEPDNPDNPDNSEYSYNLEIDKLDKETKEAMDGVKFIITRNRWRNKRSKR